MDVVALAQLGFPNAVATLGTACTRRPRAKAVPLHRLRWCSASTATAPAGAPRARRWTAPCPMPPTCARVKFLFLPAEHDPDSYIREFGKDAFARYVSEAVPLSRFLIEAAREGCDLGTRRGPRPHGQQCQARCGASCPTAPCKRQLLAEIAELVQLGQRENSLHSGARARGGQASAPQRSARRQDYRPTAPDTPQAGASRRLGHAAPSSKPAPSTSPRACCWRNMRGCWEPLLSAEDHAAAVRACTAPHRRPVLRWLEASCTSTARSPGPRWREGAARASRSRPCAPAHGELTSLQPSDGAASKTLR